MAFIASTSLAGLSNSPSVPVPSGAQAGDDVVIICTRDAPAENYATSKPADFETLDIASLTADGQQIFVGHKKLTAGDTGSYTFGTQPDSWYWVCQAFLFRGRLAPDPIPADGITVAELNSPASSPVSIIAAGVTAEAGDDLLWIAAPDTTTGTTGVFAPPSGFAERTDAHADLWANLSGATKDAVSAGATGAVTGTFTAPGVSAGYAAYLIRFKAAASASGHEMSSLVTGIGTPSGALASLPAISSEVLGVGTAAGSAALLVTMSGEVVGIGTVTGYMTVEQPEPEGPQMYAVVSGLGQISGELSILPTVSADVVAAGLSSGTLSALPSAGAEVYGVGTNSGALAELPGIGAIVSVIGVVVGGEAEPGAPVIIRVCGLVISETVTQRLQFDDSVLQNLIIMEPVCSQVQQ